MSIKRFQEISAALLTKHYGLDLNDTSLTEDDIVAQCIKQGARPYQVVAEHAQEADLYRVDVKGDYGIPSKRAITEADEDAVIQNLPIPSIQFATHMSDYVRASTMYDAFTRDRGSMFYQNYAETLAMYKPSRRSESWFRAMLANGRCYLTEDEQAFVLNDRFVNTVIGERHGDFDGIEIQGTRDLKLPGDPSGPCFVMDGANPQFFSTFARSKEGGVACIGVFATHGLAEEYANGLATKYQWPVNDLVPSKWKMTPARTQT